MHVRHVLKCALEMMYTFHFVSHSFDIALRDVTMNCHLMVKVFTIMLAHTSFIINVHHNFVYPLLEKSYAKEILV